MAGLAFRTERRELNPALGNIGELKNVIFHSVLRERGFTDVVNTPSEVAGNRNGCRVAILHLHIADRDFWRVAMCMCDGGFDPARATVDEVSDAINELAFL
ncbi:MAG: hypothetical protein H0V24_16665 [Chloroflexia bacterium]|nr:hypothetical protein [Chloroflexia bacterium]MDQ3412789.1 hypothetical protein [Chloroflexota bacterium]